MCAADFRLPLRKNMAKIVAGYLTHGLRVVKVYRTIAVGVCGCKKGAACPMPGKHPKGKEWASSSYSSTVDEEVAMEWWADDHTAPNVGVVLGPMYGVPGRGIFDVEADNDEGRALLRKLGLERFETPTFESGKSPHRLMQFESWLPKANVFTWKGVEVRLGFDGMEQSVMPPSIHHTGRMYRWVEGFSLDDVEIAPAPPLLREWILESYEAYCKADGGEAGRESAGRGRALLRRQHNEAASERHDALMSFAGLLSRSVHLGDEADEHLFLGALRAVNQCQCVPPKPDDEVVACWRDALKYRALDASSAKLCEGIAIEGRGKEQRFVPAGLELTIVKSDPPSYRLFCEGWKKFNKTGVATLSAEDFMSAKKAAVALATQVGGLRLDRWPGDWSRIWDGKAGKPKTQRSDGEEPVVGLRTLLLDEAVTAGRIEDVVDPARHRLRRLASMLYGALARLAGCQADVTRTEKDDWLLFSRGAQWIPASDAEDAELVLWFAWHSTWAEVEKAYRVEPNEGGRLVAAMPEIIGRKLAAQKKQINGQRSSFRTLTQDEWRRLEQFAIGESEENALLSQHAIPASSNSEEERIKGTLVRGEAQEAVCL
jgi:hypothetical protein